MSLWYVLRFGSECVDRKLKKIQEQKGSKKYKLKLKLNTIYSKTTDGLVRIKINRRLKYYYCVHVFKKNNEMLCKITPTKRTQSDTEEPGSPWQDSLLPPLQLPPESEILLAGENFIILYIVYSSGAVCDCCFFCRLGL